ncbi:hypothetical protein NMY22_g1679 [Coprinellus aureogranulatus]|nr:hypothetical protein NMY22_g1679 [Coprinellus aureogranulatus]
MNDQTSTAITDEAWQFSWDSPSGAYFLESLSRSTDGRRRIFTSVIKECAGGLRQTFTVKILSAWPQAGRRGLGHAFKFLEAPVINIAALFGSPENSSSDITALSQGLLPFDEPYDIGLSYKRVGSWHEFKITWPGPPPNGEEVGFYLQWREETVAGQRDRRLKMTAGATLGCTITIPFDSPDKPIMEISPGLLESLGEGNHSTWDNMRAALIVYSAFCMLRFIRSVS